MMAFSLVMSLYKGKHPMWKEQLSNGNPNIPYGKNYFHGNVLSERNRAKQKLNEAETENQNCRISMPCCPEQGWRLGSTRQLLLLVINIWPQVTFPCVAAVATMTTEDLKEQGRVPYVMYTELTTRLKGKFLSGLETKSPFRGFYMCTTNHSAIMR